MACTWSTFLFLSHLAVGCTALSVDRFIPFGTDREDAVFFSNDDDTTSISVPVRFPFYDRQFRTIHAAVPDFTPKDFPLKSEDSVRGVGVAFIAPFWADVDTRGGLGTVFFRSTTDQSTLAQIKDIVSNSKAGFRFTIQFKPIWALVVTWEQVGYYDGHGGMQNNTFQVAVVTGGLFSFAIFNYAKLTWVTGDASGGSGGFGGTAAMVGINAGDGVNFKKFKQSLTDRVIEVLNDTNMNDCSLRGQYVYQIDTVSIFDDTNCNDATFVFPSFGIVCSPETISLSPSFGAVHTGGFVVISGPPGNLINAATAVKIAFGDDGQELSCHFQQAVATVICPVPLFHPESAGWLDVTFTVAYIIQFPFPTSGVCTFNGQYKVDPPRPFMEGAVMITEEDDFDCGQPMSKPVLIPGDRFCLTWNADQLFARDQVTSFQASGIEVNVTMHYLSSTTTLANHGVESGWKTFDLDRESLVELIKGSSGFSRPLLSDEAAIVDLHIAIDMEEIYTPVPVLLFIKVSIIGAGIDMFASSPLVSLLPKSSDPQMSMTTTQCDNIIPTLDRVLVNRIPCPGTMRQAFLDSSLVVDSGCILNPSNPNAAFNCYLNPGAMQCFLQRNISNASQIVGQCCYDTKDILFTKLNGGGLDRKEDPGKRYFEHFSKDLWPIIVCCEELKILDANCQKILNDKQEFFKGSFSQGYTAPDYATSEANLLTQSTFLIAPLNVTIQSGERLTNESREKLFICYRFFGELDPTFNLLSDTWISVNVQFYTNISASHISAVGIKLFDNGTAQCIEVVITAQDCSVTINGVNATEGPLVIGQYQFEFTSLDKSLMISRQGSTKGFSPVIRVSCLPSSAAVNQNNLYLHVSDTLPQSHGLLGQLWNVPADVRPLLCGGHNLSMVTGRQMYEIVVNPNTAKERAIAGTWYPLTWNFSHPGPCIYAGDWFAGPNIIEGNLQDYKVTPENNLLATDFVHSKFPSSACSP